jgi:hypothetical protein
MMRGLLPILITCRNSLVLQGVAFLVSIIGYAIAEIIVGTEYGPKPVRQKVGAMRNMLFLAILFLALAMLTREWISAGWSEQLQIGFLMLSATYYSITLMQLAFIRA